MKHCIIVKWNEQGNNDEARLADIEAIFGRTRDIPGVRGVRLVQGVNRGGNRFDLMIEMDMDLDSLPAYNASEPHREWKERYGRYIDKKAIFDYE